MGRLTHCGEAEGGCRRAALVSTMAAEEEERESELVVAVAILSLGLSKLITPLI